MNNIYQLTLRNAAKAASYDILGAKIRSAAEESRRQEQELQNWWTQLDQDEEWIENETDE